MTSKPIPKLVERTRDPVVYEAAQKAGYTPLQSRILAGRMPVQVAPGLRRQVAPSLRALDGPEHLPDIEIAASTLADAVMGGNTIACVLDHDCDGCNAGAVLQEALVDHFHVPQERVLIVPSHRMREGYGVSDALTDRLLADLPKGALVITADQGSTDEPRIARLAAAGHKVIVTDHHGIPEEGIPRSAVACVNPTRSDSHFPDPLIAGTHVAWLVACATRQELITRGYLPGTAPTLATLIDFVGLAATADAVSMVRSANNRAAVNFGLKLMNTAPRPAWQALAELLKKETPFTASDLGFAIGPRINARGRLGEASMGIEFLRSKTFEHAQQALAVLDQENQARKAIEKSMLDSVMEEASLQAELGLPAIVVYLPDGHAGVHGIVASRLVDAFGRPAVCFSPKQGKEGVITGSLRAIPGVHVREAMAAVARDNPGLFHGFGGHQGAGGCMIDLSNFVRFQDAYNAAVEAQVCVADMAPRILTDGEVGEDLSMALLVEIESLGPYGREFDAPVFQGCMQVVQLRAVGDGTHFKMKLMDHRGAGHDAIWFKAIQSAGDDLPVEIGMWCDVAFGLAANTYRGRTTLDVHVKHMQPRSEEA